MKNKWRQEQRKHILVSKENFNELFSEHNSDKERIRARSKPNKDRKKVEVARCEHTGLGSTVV